MDSRRTSIAAALAFAKDKSLAGVVLPAEVKMIYSLVCPSNIYDAS